MDTSKFYLILQLVCLIPDVDNFVGAPGFECVPWTEADKVAFRAAGGTIAAKKSHCEDSLGRLWTHGKNAQAPGCDPCWCCTKNIKGNWLNLLSQFQYIFPGALPGPLDVSRNFQLVLLGYLGKEYKISLEFFITKFGADAYQSVIHFTLGGNMGKYGDRTPAVWIKNNKAVHIASAISGNPNAYFDICCVAEQKWTKVEISQTLVDGKVWIP